MRSPLPSLKLLISHDVRAQCCVDTSNYLKTSSHTDSPLACRYDAKGFLMNDVYMEGAVLCAGELAALWKVESLADITEDSLALLLLMKPAPGPFLMTLFLW